MVMVSLHNSRMLTNADPIFRFPLIMSFTELSIHIQFSGLCLSF